MQTVKMVQVGNLKFLVIFSILLLINDTSGIKCWRCSTDTTNAKYCGEILDQSQQQQKWFYVECLPLKGVEVDNIKKVIPKCKIKLEIVNKIRVYSRSCHWEEENVPANSCLAENDLSFVKTIACNTCTEDGCNNKLASASEPIHEESSAADLSKTTFLTVVTSLVFGLL